MTNLESRLNPRRELSRRLNWLRAAVLGANDGIVSTAGILMGVAGATTDNASLLIAGIASLVAGSISMAGGEYASVSAQRDSEKAALAREKRELEVDPEGELLELANYYRGRGISEGLSLEVAKELTKTDALKAHSDAELGIDEELVSPVAAAIASFFSFALGSVLPILAILGPWPDYKELAVIFAVVIALALTGYFGAKIGKARPLRAIIRNVTVSLVTMGAAYLIGQALGVALS